MSNGVRFIRKNGRVIPLNPAAYDSYHRNSQKHEAYLMKVGNSLTIAGAATSLTSRKKIPKLRLGDRINKVTIYKNKLNKGAIAKFNSVSTLKRSLVGTGLILGGSLISLVGSSARQQRQEPKRQLDSLLGRKKR